MKVRAVLKSLLFSYALTGVALLLLAFLLFTFDLGGYYCSICDCLLYGWLYGRKNYAQG